MPRDGVIQSVIASLASALQSLVAIHRHSRRFLRVAHPSPPPRTSESHVMVSSKSRFACSKPEMKKNWSRSSLRKFRRTNYHPNPVVYQLLLNNTLIYFCGTLNSTWDCLYDECRFKKRIKFPELVLIKITFWTQFNFGNQRPWLSESDFDQKSKICNLKTWSLSFLLRGESK